ncbi:MAG: hypothetical protein JWL98_2186 [Xanthomonadaceae bacterium]|nr:hypothetical protein [Xanthomonadaceae bacterium]
MNDSPVFRPAVHARQLHYLAAQWHSPHLQHVHEAHAQAGWHLQHRQEAAGELSGADAIELTCFTVYSLAG